MLNYCSIYQVEREELDDNGCFGQWQAVQNVPERVPWEVMGVCQLE